MTEITQADHDAVDLLYEMGVIAPRHLRLANEAFARHRLEERAKIVAWLRKLSGYDSTTSTFQDRRLAHQLAALEFSNAIEAGEHLK